MQFPTTTPEPQLIEPRAFLQHYFESGQEPPFHLPRVMNSPICSLFSADLVREWTTHVRAFCCRRALRRKIMWYGGIGPDLMLYLMAMAPNRPKIAYVPTCTAQFSEHAGSITISSKRNPLEMGYWFARKWFVEEFYSDVDGPSATWLRDDVAAKGKIIRRRLKKKERDFIGLIRFSRELSSPNISGPRRNFPRFVMAGL